MHQLSRVLGATLAAIALTGVITFAGAPGGGSALGGGNGGTAVPPGRSPVARPAGVELVDKIDKPANAHRLEEKDFAGYMMVYFKDQTHCAYLAVSRDGNTFTDINGGEPVFDGTLLAEQRGVRDPYMCRGPDGAFYLAMTDLHTNGRRAGFRQAQWERPEPQYGWGNNRSLVMMKSFDLIHWTHTAFRIDKAFPECAEVGCCWAPAMTYDDGKGKMLISFTMKLGRGIDNIYYSYTDDAFTRMETAPQILFRFPAPSAPENTLTDNQRNVLHVIDSDITKVGNKYHLFYSSKESGTPGIEHSVSDKLTGPYPVTQKRIDPENVSCEAPTLYKRLGTDTYILMYDAYGAGNMGFSETKDFETYKNLGLFNHGTMKGTNFNAPKHGAVTYLTMDELKVVKEHWKLDIKLD